jgi:hypothetical protein
MTSAAINRINNVIPHFPTATEESKFPESELLALLEWSLPAKWRETFNPKGNRKEEEQQQQKYEIR